MPPSQGGRYSGFGSAPTEEQSRGNADPAAELMNTAMNTFSKGLSFFSSATSHVAQVAQQTAQTAWREVDQKYVQNPEFRGKVEGFLETVGHTVHAFPSLPCYSSRD